MKLTQSLLAGVAATGLLFASLSAQAQSTSFAACVGTPLVEFDGTVVDAAIATPELSTLVTAVTAAGLGDALASAEDITVYAPTNAAFEALGGILDVALGDVDLLTNVLLYHVTPSLQDPRRFVTPVRRTTLLGGHVFYDRSGGEARVNNAALNCAGVKTSNGRVFLIDQVLLP